MKTIITNESRKYIQVSNWLKIKTAIITTCHSLADYADFSCTNDKKGMVDYFTFQNVKYALGQFMRFTYPEFFEDENGTTSYLSAYDCTCSYKPFVIEIDECGERVRLYIEISDD